MQGCALTCKSGSKTRSQQTSQRKNSYPVRHAPPTRHPAPVSASGGFPSLQLGPCGLTKPRTGQRASAPTWPRRARLLLRLRFVRRSRAAWCRLSAGAIDQGDGEGRNLNSACLQHLGEVAWRKVLARAKQESAPAVDRGRNNHCRVPALLHRIPAHATNPGRVGVRDALKAYSLTCGMAEISRFLDRDCLTITTTTTTTTTPRLRLTSTRSTASKR